MPGGHQFVQQFVANLTLQSKENITAKERKSEELVGILVKIGLPACSIKNLKNNNNNNKLQRLLHLSFPLPLTPKRSLEVGSSGLVRWLQLSLESPVPLHCHS